MNFDAYQVSIDHALLQGITPDLILTELKQNPLLFYHWQKNSEENKQKFIDVMIRKPTQSDCSGFIYGFRERAIYDANQTSYEIKMGRTKNEVPQSRIFEWQREDGRQYVEIFTVRSENNKKLEALVHILFAYARMLNKYVNNKRRIQWFSFKEKVPTAAAVNLLNIFMEKAHSKELKNQLSSHTLINKYAQLISSIKMSAYQKKRVVMFGLPKTGKSAIADVLFLKSQEDKSNQSKQIASINNDRESQIKSYLQISKSLSISSSYEDLIKLFEQWQQLCNCQTLLPVLVVKGGDMQSALMNGFFQGLDLFHKYIKSSRMPIVCINKATSLTLDEIELNYQENKPYLSQQNRLRIQQIIKNRSFLILPKGKISKYQKPIKQSLKNWQKQNQNLKIQFSINQELIKLCHSLIDYSYPYLQQIYLEKIEQKFKSFTNEIQKAKLISFVKSKMNILRSQKPKDKQVYKSLNQLNQELGLSQKEAVQSKLYMFCQCTANRTLKNSVLFQKMIEKYKQQQITLVMKIDREMKQNIQAFKIALNQFEQTAKIAEFKKIMNTNDSSQLKQLLQQTLIKLQGFSKSNTLIKTITTIQKTMQNIKSYQKQGFTFNIVIGQVKAAIYSSFKTQISPNTAKNPEIAKTVIVIDDDQDQQQTKNQTNSYARNNQKIKLIKNQDQKGKKQNQPYLHSILQGAVTSHHATMSQVLKNIKNNMNPGQTIVNIVDGDFAVNEVHCNLSNNIYILAKTIIVQYGWSMRFSKVGEQNKKLQMVFIGQNFVDQKKLNPPKKSNGQVSFLAKVNGEFTGLGQNFELNQNKIKEPLYQELLKLYRQKIG